MILGNLRLKDRLHIVQFCCRDARFPSNQWRKRTFRQHNLYCTLYIHGMARQGEEVFLPVFRGVGEAAGLIRQHQVSRQLCRKQCKDPSGCQNSEYPGKPPMLLPVLANGRGHKQGYTVGRDQRKQVSSEGDQYYAASPPVPGGRLAELQKEQAQVVGQHAAEGNRHKPLGSRVPGRAVPDRDQGEQADHDARDLYD